MMAQSAETDAADSGESTTDYTDDYNNPLGASEGSVDEGLSSAAALAVAAAAVVAAGVIAYSYMSKKNKNEDE